MNACLPLVLLLLGANPPAVERPADDAAKCEVLLEGEGVKELLLQEEGGKQHKVDAAQPIRLPPGHYRVLKIVVQGGYTYHDAVSINQRDWMRLAPGEPYRLRAGGPLVPTVQVTGQGNTLWMTYSQVDAAGRQYAGRERSHRPHFTVYQDGKEIASGDFEYG